MGISWPRACTRAAANVAAVFQPAAPLRSGLPTPRGRTFADAVVASAHSDAAGAAPSWLRLAAYAGPRAWAAPRLPHPRYGPSDGGAAGRRHAQKPVRLVDAGRRHSDRAANSQVPPAPSMPPAGCVAARVTAQSSMPPTRCVAARITAQSSMPPAGCGIAPTLEPSGPRSITPRPTPPAAAGGGERRRESTAGARGPCGPQPPSAAETRLPRGRTRSRGGCGSRHRRPA